MQPSSGRPRARTIATVILAAALSTACASSRTTDATTEAAAPAKAPRRQPNVITHQELAGMYERTAYDAIQALRPTMLRYRGPTSILLDTPTQPEVFVDGMYYGRMSTLQQIQATDCWQIQYLNVGQATIKYGQGHPAGVIDIITKH